MTHTKKFKRLPKGQRAYVRRLKQTAHKDGIPYNPSQIRRVPAKPSQKSNTNG